MRLSVFVLLENNIADPIWVVEQVHGLSVSDQDLGLGRRALLFGILHPQPLPDLLHNLLPDKLGKRRPPGGGLLLGQPGRGVLGRRHTFPPLLVMRGTGYVPKEPLGFSGVEAAAQEASSKGQCRVVATPLRGPTPG